MLECSTRRSLSSLQSFRVGIRTVKLFSHFTLLSYCKKRPEESLALCRLLPCVALLTSLREATARSNIPPERARLRKQPLAVQTLGGQWHGGRRRRGERREHRFC
jgi:hypothetical protein